MYIKLDITAINKQYLLWCAACFLDQRSVVRYWRIVNHVSIY